MSKQLYEFRRDDAYNFARHLGVETFENHNKLHFKVCPYCHGNSGKDRKTFAINLETGQFKCLRESCGVTGNMITLSRDFDFSLGNEADEYYRPQKQYRRFPKREKPEPKEKAIVYLEKRMISAAVAKAYHITVQKEHENILVFPFYNQKDELEFIKYRKTDYDPEKDQNKEWCEKGGRPILFGMDQCNNKFDRLVVTEGQLDSLSVAEAGIENAVSVPTGSKGFTWIPYCWDWMTKFKEIVVFGDYEKGHITLLDDIARRFPGKTKHIREPDYLGCKDANEILQKHGKEAVRAAVKNAIPLPVKRVIDLSTVKAVNPSDLPKLKTGIAQLDRLLYGGMPFGNVVLLTGKRGDGKSTLGSQILVNALEQGKNVFAYSGELPNYLFKSWMDSQTAGGNHIIENYEIDGTPKRSISNGNMALINDWYRDRAFLYDNSIIEDDEKEDLLKTIESVIQQYGTEVILIDNLMTAMFENAADGSDKYDQQGKFVGKLSKMALQYNCLIILVAHKRKNGYGHDMNDEISGSGDISNLAGIVLSYDRPTDYELKNNIAVEDQRLLRVGKNRVFGRTDTKGMVLDYDERSKRIYGHYDDLYHEYGWLGAGGQLDIDDMEDIPFD